MLCTKIAPHQPGPDPGCAAHLGTNMLTRGCQCVHVIVVQELFVCERSVPSGDSHGRGQVLPRANEQRQLFHTLENPMKYLENQEVSNTPTAFAISDTADDWARATSSAKPLNHTTTGLRNTANLDLLKRWGGRVTECNAPYCAEQKRVAPRSTRRARPLQMVRLRSAPPWAPSEQVQLL